MCNYVNDMFDMAYSLKRIKCLKLYETAKPAEHFGNIIRTY